MTIFYSVNGGWGSWYGWGSCSATCGGGTNQRTRHCDNPVPMYGGSSCSGSSVGSTTCNTNGCPGKIYMLYSCTFTRYIAHSLLNKNTKLSRLFLVKWTVAGEVGKDGGLVLRGVVAVPNSGRPFDNSVPMYGGSSCSGHSVEYATCYGSYYCAGNKNWKYWTVRLELHCTTCNIYQWPSSWYLLLLYHYTYYYIQHMLDLKKSFSHQSKFGIK